MNEFNFRIEKSIAGYKAYLRCASDAEAKPILTKGGKVKIFETKADAAIALIENLCRYINGNLVRDGETLSLSPKAAGDALFPTLVKQKGRERRIPVVFKGKGRSRV